MMATSPDLDTPETTIRHREILERKPLLKNWYRRHYRRFMEILGNISAAGQVLELGSGPGFLKEFLPGVITSDVIDLPWLDVMCSAAALPFRARSLKGIFMMNVLHHLPRPEEFFDEISRSLETGGVIMMVEPANTLFSRFIYRNFHHEPFDPKGEWGFDSQGPLSSANGALPWIIFVRDRAKFDQRFPALQVKEFAAHSPLGYLLTGGYSFHQLLPSCCLPLIRGIERLLVPFNPFLGMFYTIVIEKKAAGPSDG